MMRLVDSALNQIHKNLSLECALVRSATKSPTLFTWRNRDCVVIGRNQNPYSECDLERLRKDGVDLCRRRSGGGAVFQDLGNSVFTFIEPAQGEFREFVRQNNAMLIEALSQLSGRPVTASGRNDLLIDGLKVCGNAYQQTEGKFVHHGCLLRAADLSRIPNYLTPHPLKFVDKKGTESVRQRVTSVLEASGRLIEHEAFTSLLQSIYSAHKSGGGSPPLSTRVCGADDIAAPERAAFERELGELTDPVWTYGATAPYATAHFGRVPDLGVVELRLCYEQDVVTDVQLFSDAADPQRIQQLQTEIKHALCGQSAPQNFDVEKTVLLRGR